MFLQLPETQFVPDRVQENTFVPFHFELWFCLEKFLNDVSLNFHNFGLSLCLNCAFWGLTISEIIWIDNISQTPDEIEIVVLLFHTAWNNDMNNIYVLAFFDDILPFFISFLDRFHSDLDNLITSEIWKQRTVSQNIAKPDLVSLKLTKVHLDDSSVDFLS